MHKNLLVMKNGMQFIQRNCVKSFTYFYFVRKRKL